MTSGRTIYPKLVTRQWIETQRAEWGEDSPAFRARVLGEFPEESDSRLVPLAWLHAAQERRARLNLERAIEGRVARSPVAMVLLLFPALLATALVPVVVQFVDMLGAL